MHAGFDALRLHATQHQQCQRNFTAGCSRLGLQSAWDKPQDSSAILIWKGNGMDENFEFDASDEALIAYLMSQVALMRTFAVAVARSHPNPPELLSAFERTIAEDEKGEEPLLELTPENQQARKLRDLERDMLLRVIRSRVSP